MPGMLELALVIGGCTNGPIIGVFTLGMLVPWVSNRGALGGFLTGVILTSWVAGGATVYRDQLSYTSVTSPKYPDQVSQCPDTWLLDMANVTVTHEVKHPLPGYLPVYELSYIWYSALGIWTWKHKF